MSSYKPQRGKSRLEWVEGTDSLGRSIKYRSLVDYIEPLSIKIEEKEPCNHDWESYKGFLIDDTYCIKCKEVKK